MTATDVTTIACEASPDCLHPACHVCLKPIYHGRQRKKHHPGTVFGVWRDRLCNRCKIYGHKPYKQPKPEPTPKVDPLALNESHVLLSDYEMERLEREYPVQHAWHLWRREHRLKIREYS